MDYPDDYGGFIMSITRSVCVMGILMMTRTNIIQAAKNAPDGYDQKFVI